MPKDPKNRILRKIIDGAYLYTEDFSATGLKILPAATGGPGVGQPINSEGWEIFTQSSSVQSSFAFNRQYFDLKGYTKKDQSFFPTAPQVQDMGAFQGVPTGFAVYDFMTVKPVDDACLERFVNPVNLITPPASSSNFLDLTDIIYASWRLFDPSTDTQGSSVITQAGTYGLASPTARSRIFLCRIVTIANGDNTIVFIPPCAYVLGGVSAEEKDLVYIERLRRSYDHSTPVG